MAKARASRSLAMIGACGAALALIGCAQQPLMRTARSKEYFPEAVYGRASPRLIADGSPIPHGGGQYLLGRPYVVAGRVYVPRQMNPAFTQVGTASWYGDAFHGRRTANGEIYDKNGVTAAHPTMPLPSFARVTNLRNGRSMVVRVNDRGPYHSGRVMDVSARVADALDFKRYGMAQVRVDYIGPASLAGSDDRQLLASLRTDGRPAVLGGPPETMLASNQAPAHSPLSALLGRPAAAPEPVAAVHPVETTLVVETPPETARTASARAAPLHTAYLAERVPLPPARPLDLRTIPGAGVPIGASRTRRTAAIFYAPPASPKRRLESSPQLRSDFINYGPAKSRPAE